MRLLSSTVQASPEPGRVRLAGRVAYADDHPDETIWFDFPASLEKALSLSGNLWLVLLLPLAATLGEPLELIAAIDPLLRMNAEQLLGIWQSWYPKLSDVRIDAPVSNSLPWGEKSLAFLSGGVDSFYTVLNANVVNLAVFVWGFDIEIGNRPAFKRYWRRLRQAADDLEQPIAYVATNLRQSRMQQADWARLYHGSALASIALSLEAQYGRALISSTHTEDQLMPWGSTCVTDPLSSTSHFDIVHYGGDTTRFAKTAVVAASPAALSALRVCSHSRSDVNCSRCNKCYRTMIGLELLDALESCDAFDRHEFQLERIADIYSDNANAIAFLQELESFARERGREDIAAGIRQSFRHSAQLRKILKVPRFLQHQRYLWRYSAPIEKLILSRSIH